MTKPVNRPKLKPGPKRIYRRDSLSKTKRGRQAIKAIEKIRVKALRTNHVAAKNLKEIEAKKEGRPLTDKQRMFVRYWAQGETPRTAAIMAGYAETSSRMGWTLSHDPAILTLYREEKKLYEEAANLSRAKVMGMLKEAYDDAKLLSEPATMVAAARELGKMAGYYEPEKKIIAVVGGKVAEQMLRMTDEELLKIIEENPDAIDGEFTRVADAAALPAPS